MIYLDHAATTPLCKESLQAMLPYLQNQYANPSSSYSMAREARRAIDQAKIQIAALVGANPQEIYVTSGGTESDNWALSGIMRASKAGKRHLIVSSVEHHAVLETCRSLEKDGFSISYAPVDYNGVVDVDRIKCLITPETAMVSVMLANNESGVIQPVKEIAEIAHQHGCLMHTDAVQAAGHIPISIQELGVDLLSLSAHKFYGPKGIGALYIKKGTRIERLIYGGEQEKGMRAGTENVAGIVGMGKAAEIARESLGEDSAHTSGLRDLMIGCALEQLKNIRINGLNVERLPGHVHMTIDQAKSALLLMQLDMHGIAASSGSACASGASTRSHVMHAMGMSDSNQADIRFTLGRENTREDVLKTIEVLKSLLNE